MTYIVAGSHNISSYFLGRSLRFRYSHISLCLFYSSLLKFLLLVVLSIWGPQVPKDTPPPAYVHKMPLESPLWHLLDDDVLDRTWLVRNLLGGMSAGFGLRSASSSLYMDFVKDTFFLANSVILNSGARLSSGFHQPHHFVGMRGQNRHCRSRKGACWSRSRKGCRGDMARV